MRHQEDTAARVWQEYESGRRFKNGLGHHGLYEQNRRNERFFVGDQWHGAKTGGDRPLVRHNVIKRIGDYKMSVIGSNPLSVAFSADGIPNTVELTRRADRLREQMRQAQASGSLPSMPEDQEAPISGDEVELVMGALSEYFTATANRLNLEEKKECVLRDAYVSGTGFLYTYWDPEVQTGLYADVNRRSSIRGDIAVETLDVENVYFGDPNTPDIQSQPYMLIAQRQSVSDLKRRARENGIPEEEIAAIRPDNEVSFMAGDRALQEPYESRKATVITRLWKERDPKTKAVRVKAVQTCKQAVIRREWDLGIRLYPLAMFTWERRKGCAYGDSEVTYLIPNQIAINRMITASVWAVMMMGIPMTVVNGDVVQEAVTNDPGQVLRVFGSAEDVATAVKYVDPPQFSPQFDVNIQSLINNTLAQSGANDAALGNLRPDNASAIVAVREAATMPMQPVQNRFYRFIGDLGRIWAEFWVMKYGRRFLKIEAEDGAWYMPFSSERYRDLIISVRVDVGASTLWGETQTVTTLDNLLANNIITPQQYISRLPHGVIPQQQSLLRELGVTVGNAESEASLAELLPPAYQEQLSALPPDQARELIERAIS
ncbi:MAG: hypothetical protein IKV35_06340 [Clostridia bacterium]|nr:hypothetical protein [Clostridia bacterium]